MPYRYTLNDAREAGIANVSGVCVDSDQFTQWGNEVQRRLLKRGNWWGTEWLVRFCIYNACLTLPRYIGTLLGVRPCGMDSVDIQNNWYSILRPCDCSFGSNTVVSDNGTAPTYSEITGSTGKAIRVYLEHGNDAGKTITIFGIDGTTNGPLQEERDGIWQPGIRLTLAAPYVATTQLVKRITSVLKDETEGQLFLYEYDSSTALLRDIARYEPSETNPRYRRHAVHNLSNIPICSTTDGVGLRKLEAMVKLEFIPVKHGNDFLMIDDFDALKLGFQAMRLEEAGDDNGAETKWLKAIRELHFTDRDKTPLSQTPVRVQLVGGALSSPM